MAGKRSLIDRYSKEKFNEIVKNSYSIADALRKLGYKNDRSKRTRNSFKNRIEKENINIDHFNQHYNNGISNKRRWTDEDIFVTDSKYTNRHEIKKRILKGNYIKYECEKCKNDGYWLGEMLSLHLDHKNGISDDNRLENLRFLCPNCHAQTETYAGKNNGVYVLNIDDYIS